MMVQPEFFNLIFQDAFVWVLLDGGPSRAFSETDFSLLEDDFTMLKVCEYIPFLFIVCFLSLNSLASFCV